MANTSYLNPQEIDNEVFDQANQAVKTEVFGGQSAVTQAPVLVTQAPKAPFQTMKTFTGTLTTSTSAAVVSPTLYTVTTGKTFYLTDVIICNNTANAAQVSINGSITAGANPVLIAHALNTAPLDAINIGTEPSVAAGTPVTVQALQTLAITTLTYFVAGYEQ